MKKLIKGIECVILSEDGRGGFTSIDVDKLTTKVEDLFAEEALTKMEADHPPGFRNMTLIALIKYDSAREDKMGWGSTMQP